MERTKKQNFTGTKSQEEKIQELKANYDYISGIKVIKMMSCVFL